MVVDVDFFGDVVVLVGVDVFGVVILFFLVFLGEVELLVLVGELDVIGNDFFVFLVVAVVGLTDEIFHCVLGQTKDVDFLFIRCGLDVLDSLDILNDLDILVILIIFQS